MNYHVCEKCNKEFTHKGHYINHLARKKPCNEKLKKYQKYFNCKNCKQSFTRNYNLIKHSKKCKKIINNINIENEFDNESCEIIDLKIKLERQDEELNIIKNLILNIKNTDLQPQIIENQTNNVEQNNIENQTIVNNNIYIINYKDEKIDDKDMKEILSNEDPILHAIEKIHCNENIPKQHNVLIKDKTRNNIFIYENEKWNLKNKNQTLNNIYSSTIKKITDKITDKENDIIEVVNTNIPDKYENVETENFVSERNYFYKNPKNMKKTSSRVNELIYNNKEIINNTKNKNDSLLKKNNKVKKIKKIMEKEFEEKNNV